MGAYKDLSGKRFGKLTVLHESEERANGCIQWVCQCDCGEITVKKGILLTQGNTKSCGCIKQPSSKRFSDKYGENAKYGFAKKEYSAWLDVKRRCYNKNTASYPLYGGRGIVMDDEWKYDFLSFYEYVGPKPSDDYSLDRIDSNKNYEPGNVRWATREEQSRNHLLHKTNCTGMSNVSFVFDEKNGTTTCVGEVSLDTGDNRIRRSRSRSVDKYGLLPAVAMVSAWRQEELAKLQEEFGVVYSKFHGNKREVINDEI